MAIMGQSGAGKTSLLNILSFRAKNSKTQFVNAEMKLNRADYTLKKFSKIGVYVMQVSKGPNFSTDLLFSMISSWIL